MKEYVFRITQKQLDIVSKQLESCNDQAFVLVECGYGKAILSQDCERIAWCAHKILSSCSIVSASKVINKKYGYCVFATSYEHLKQLHDSGMSAQLWAFLNDSSLQVLTTSLCPVTVSCVVGHDLQFCFSGRNPMMEQYKDDNQFYERTMQAFGKGTTQYLSQLTVAVAGASGTGSIVAEQLLRLGVKRLILIDDDIVETRNLGRILNSRIADAENSVFKAVMLHKAYQKIGLPTEVIAAPTIISEPNTIHMISVCDIIFGCLDSVDGRHHLNRISTFYNIPYIDMGVKLVSDCGNITEISGAVRYVIPGESSLRSRGVYSLEQLESDTLRRSDPTAYQARLKEKYIQGASESNPAVISINMQIASLSVLELLARLHPYREISNNQIETIMVDLISPHFPTDAPTAPDKSLLKYVGIGDYTPLLNMPALGVAL